MLIKILFFFLCVSICVGASAQVEMYKVNKIKSLGKYYVVYAVRNDSTYKIVSRKEKLSDCRKIRKNGIYPLGLSKIQILGGSEIDCISFDKKTVICKEPDADLYVTTNLKGLCLIDK